MKRTPLGETAAAFVYFDLGNVLAQFDVDRACRNLQRRWALPPDAVRAAIWHSGLQDRFEHGEVTAEEFAEAIRCEFRLAPESAATADLLDLLSDMFEPVEEMVDVVDAVRAAGMPVGLLSNTCEAHWQWLQRQRYPALVGHFDRVILSYEHGIMKPHPSLHRLAEEASGVPPQSILFFDDRVENVEAALAAGWQAHRFTEAESARRVLRSAGVPA